MARSATIVSRVDVTKKEEAVKILNELGLSVSEAVNLFINQIILNKGLPFKVKIPNKTTAKVLKEAEEGKNITEYKNISEMFKDLKLNAYWNNN